MNKKGEKPNKTHQILCTLSYEYIWNEPSVMELKTLMYSTGYSTVEIRYDTVWENFNEYRVQRTSTVPYNVQQQ